MKTNALTIRKQIKQRKPTYTRVQSNQFKKLERDSKWRKPKGMGNKDRLNKKGHRGTLKVGYGSPKVVRGTDKNGMRQVLVHTLDELKTLDNKTQVAVLGRTLGGRKKLALLEYAKKNSISFVNVVDIAKSMEELKQKGTSKKKKDSGKKTQENKKSSQKKATASESDDKKGEEEQNTKSTSKQSSSSKNTQSKKSETDSNSKSTDAESKKSQKGGSEK